MHNIFSFKELFQDDCTFSLTEQNIAINDHNDAMILSIGHHRYKTKHNLKKRKKKVKLLARDEFTN